MQFEQQGWSPYLRTLMYILYWCNHPVQFYLSHICILSQRHNPRDFLVLGLVTCAYI